MHSILKEIIEQKKLEVARLKASGEYEQDPVHPRVRTQSFKQMIAKPKLSFITEIKRKSPSKGKLADIPEPEILLEAYIKGNASAISVLTDEKFFGGSNQDLVRVAKRLDDSPIAILRKDFTIDERQTREAYAIGADAILLIVTVLQDKTKALYEHAKSLGLDVLVEVHDKAELDYAIEIGADIIGINNRNLNTFEENIDLCLTLKKQIPKGVISVAESAIRTKADIAKVIQAGFDAVLIGEALVKAGDAYQTLCDFQQ